MNNAAQTIGKNSGSFFKAESQERVMTDTIKAIYGMEPMREGEYPSGFEVGKPFGGGSDTVSEIKERHDNFGDHGIGWFDVYAG